MEGQQGSQVFVIAGNTADIRKVKVGRTVGDMTIVTEGLNPGELVVTSGQLRVSPGAKVNIVEARNLKSPKTTTSG